VLAPVHDFGAALQVWHVPFAGGATAFGLSSELWRPDRKVHKAALTGCLAAIVAFDLVFLGITSHRALHGSGYGFAQLMAAGWILCGAMMAAAALGRLRDGKDFPPVAGVLGAVLCLLTGVVFAAAVTLEPGLIQAFS